MIKLMKGDCIEMMRKLKSESIDCCITSPPYWLQRDYLDDDQIGQERTREEYVSKLVEVFREVKRTLRKDGTLWLNMGDTYARRGGAAGGGNRGLSHMEGISRRMYRLPSNSGLKEKDLVGIPWMIAFALRDDGWWLRQDIIWCKPNPMPESMNDRCTQAHEYLFLLSKSKKYHCDMKSIREPAVGEKGNRKLFRGGGDYTSNNTIRRGMPRNPNRVMGNDGNPGTRNRHSVWTVSNPGYNGPHYSTFPPKLIEPCVIAGCPPGGTILDPFAGTGTTGVVAKQHGRNAILIDLDGEFGRIKDEVDREELCQIK